MRIRDKMKMSSLISATKKHWPKVEKSEIFCSTNKSLEKLNNQILFFLISLIFVYFERLNLDLREVLFQVEVETKSRDKKLMMTGKNVETGLFCNKTSPLCQQGFANFKQRLSKNASPPILGGRVNQIDVSNTDNIFTPPSALVNLEED